MTCPPRRNRQLQPTGTKRLPLELRPRLNLPSRAAGPTGVRTPGRRQAQPRRRSGQGAPMKAGRKAVRRFDGQRAPTLKIGKRAPEAFAAATSGRRKDGRAPAAPWIGHPFDEGFPVGCALVGLRGGTVRAAAWTRAAVTHAGTAHPGGGQPDGHGLRRLGHAPTAHLCAPAAGKPAGDRAPMNGGREGGRLADGNRERLRLRSVSES